MADWDEASEAQSKSNVSLRPATPEDRFRIRRWLGEPGVAAWGNAASAEAEINLAMGSTGALCCIVERAGIAAGYTHAIEVGLLGGSWPEGLEAGTWHVNFLIAEDGRADCGIEVDVLSALVAEVFSGTLAVACAGVVSIRSEALARVYERAGFRWQQICDDRLLGPSWLMLLDRPR